MIVWQPEIAAGGCISLNFLRLTPTKGEERQKILIGRGNEGGGPKLPSRRSRPAVPIGQPRLQWQCQVADPRLRPCHMSCCQCLPEFGTNTSKVSQGFDCIVRAVWTVWRLHCSYSVQVGLDRIGVSHHSGPHSQNCILISRDYPGEDPALFSAEEVPHKVRVSFCHGSEKIGRSDLL